MSQRVESAKLLVSGSICEIKRQIWVFDVAVQGLFGGSVCKIWRSTSVVQRGAHFEQGALATVSPSGQQFVKQVID
jgi:hypothetical protein